jgi:hypothetical protein
MTDVPVPLAFEWGDDAVADLRSRLAQTRWPERETVDDWSQGVPLAYRLKLDTCLARRANLAGIGSNAGMAT